MNYSDHITDIPNPLQKTTKNPGGKHSIEGCQPWYYFDRNPIGSLCIYF